MKIRLITLFSGYDSQALAMERLKRDYPNEFDYELVAWCEIDKAACMAHDAIFPQWKDRNLGDISKVKAEDIPDCDCMTWSFPCTDISGAGKQMGLSKDSGTRSSLCWEAIRCFKAKRPKFLLMENVAALAQRRFIKDFHALQYELEQMGYSNFCAILDSSKFGVPQHRERLFMISILDCTQPYYFPKPFKLEKRIKDILEPYGTVDESFYFSAKQLASMLNYCDKKKSEGAGFQTQFTDENGIASCDTTRYGASYTDAYLKEPTLHQRLSIYADNAQAGRVYDVEGTAPTVKCYTGGNSEPKIQTIDRQSRIRSKVMPNGNIRFFQDDESKSGISEMQIIHPDNECPTITTAHVPKILEPVAVRMIGRNPDNPSDRTKGAPLKQTLEFGDGVANCITTVQKDSMVREPIAEGISVHPLSHKLEFKGMGDVKDISPTLRATDYKCPHCLWEKHLVSIEDLPDKTVLKDEDGKGYLWQDGSLWRVRRLTNKEVFRLMDVSDEDIEKIQSYPFKSYAERENAIKDAIARNDKNELNRIKRESISKSAQYSMAGNSIVKSCIFHIFRRLWIDTEDNSAQKSLFDL